MNLYTSRRKKEAEEDEGNIHGAFLHRTIWEWRSETSLYGHCLIAHMVPIQRGKEELGWPEVGLEKNLKLPS